MGGHNLIVTKLNANNRKGPTLLRSMERIGRALLFSRDGEIEKAEREDLGKKLKRRQRIEENESRKTIPFLTSFIVIVKAKIVISFRVSTSPSLSPVSVYPGDHSGLRGQVTLPPLLFFLSSSPF